MWNAPTKEKMAEVLPAFYTTEEVKTGDKIVGMHFFVGSCDWWIVEYDLESDTAFGFVNLGDMNNAEWGYIYMPELREIKLKGLIEVDFDKHWNPRPAREVKGIKIYE